MSDPKDETSPNCTVCGKQMKFEWIEWMCDVPAHNWKMAQDLMAGDTFIDMTNFNRNRLRSLMERIRPDVEVAGWVYRELEVILKGWEGK